MMPQLDQGEVVRRPKRGKRRYPNRWMRACVQLRVRGRSIGDRWALDAWALDAWACKARGEEAAIR